MRRLGWRRPVAVLVTALLCLQMMGFGTVSYADTGRSSDADVQSASAVATSGSSGESDASESSAVREDDAASNAAGGASNAGDSSSDESDFSNGGGSLTDSPSGDGDLTGTPSGDADASDDNASAEGGSQNGGAANEGAATGDGSEQDGAESAGAEGEGGSQQGQKENAADADGANGSAGEDADAAGETRDPLAWQHDLDACTIDGRLTVETSRLGAPAWDASELPDMLFATLRVSFEIIPDEDQLVSGDTVEVDLPAFAAYAPEQADGGSTPDLDAFRLNEDGTETDEAIASAQVKDGVLKATFSAAAATDDANATVRGYVDVPVSFASSLLGDAETQQPWTVQKDGDDERIVMLALPSASAVLDAWKATRNPLGMLSSALGISDGTVAAESTSTLAEETGTTVTTEAGPFDTQVFSQIIWCDNNSGNRPTPDSLVKGFIPQYSIDGGQTYYDLVDASGNVTDQAKIDLYLDDNDVSRIEGGGLIQITRSATNTYSVITKALPDEIVATTKTPVLEGGKPTYDEDGNQKFDTTETSTPIKWQLKDTNTYPGYVSGSNSTWDKQYKMLTTEIEFNVVGKVGGQALKDIFGSDEAKDFQFGASIDNKDQGSISVADAVAQDLLTITDTDDGCTITGTLPMYDEQGYPIVYYVKYTGDDSGADYYQASYDNSESASHGSANDAVYPGGTMTLRHAGTTTFNGTKVWLDGDNQTSRPAVTYTLWRYSTQGSPATASQVSVASLNSENPSTPTPNAVGFVEVTAPAGSDEIDLHKLLVEQYGEELINSLSKYDPDGYPYIYCMREEPIVGYEQVFGSVDENGNVSDTKPCYQNEKGDGWVDFGWAEGDKSRPDTDHFVYNGGTLSNRLTGTTSTQMTKTWEIAAFQDSLQNVVCTFQAQSRVKGSDDETAWQNVNASNAVQTLTSWNAETLTKTVSESFPKYDAHGNELEYRWVETNVTVDGQNTGFTRNDDGTASFTISVQTGGEGTTEELQFTSTPTTQEGDDGSFSTTIVNTFKNVTDQHVDKYWEQADGTLAQIAPDPAYSDGSATVQLFQDGALVGNFTMDGATDPSAAAIDKLEGATWQETRSYHIDFEGLPKYSPDGKRYTYLVLETNKAGWNSERTYDPETRTTRINNFLPEGEGSEIRVTKKWIDGDDAEHRYKVEVTLYAAHDMASQTKDDQGNPLHSYKQGKAVMEGIVLSEDEQWFTEVDVPIGGLTYKDFYARETALIADDGTRYPVVTRTEAQASDEYKDEGWVNAGWTNENNRRVATPEHVYEVRYQGNNTLQSLEVTNRRLGLFDLTVTKTWNDALGADEDDTRPGATLTLSCDEYPEAFSLDENGNLKVSVSGNTLPVTVTEGENNVEVDIVDADGNPADSGSARIQVDTTKQSSTYHFEGMPKYDANGMNVHYSVNETWESADHGDYYSTKTVGDYVVEPNKRHFEDHQQVSFDNNRSGTRDVVFYKEWHDNYVSEELNQRPDIYLTLYRTSANHTEPEAVPGYIHFNWSALAEEGDAANEQKVTISGLSKYDSQGAEYVYYASETMSADGTSLGYIDVQFKYDSIEAADAEMEAAAVAGTASRTAAVAAVSADAVKIDQSAESEDPTQNGTGWAIREDGTFVNRLGGDLTAQGTKLWENVPGIVSQDGSVSAQGDLPAVTIYLQRKLASEAKWPDAFATQKADGTWEVSGTVASTSELKQETTNQYTYTIDEDYWGKPLPRYDENGNRFEYRAIEIMWGLLDQPGGFTADDLKDLNLANVRDGDGTELVGKVYVIQHGETGSFLLRNVYGGNEKGKLTVKKLVSGLDQGDEYPDVTFELYRYYKGYQGDADASSPAELVATQTIPREDFSSGQATTTFDNLDIYAPDGSRWIYFVAERSIGGYTTTVGAGDIVGVQDKHLTSGEMVDGAGVVVEEGGVAMRSEDLGNADETVIADNENVDVTFANVYNPGSTSLNGEKEWIDYNNIFSVRPGAIDLTFTRTAGGMTEEVETQSNNPDAANYLNWTASAPTGNWTFTLSNIEQWASNGQAWEYHVSETLTDGADSYYTIVKGTSSATAGTSDSFTLQNALNGKATVEKSWVDGDDPYGLRPETVTVQLQAHYREAATAGADENEWSAWESARSVWEKFADKNALDDQDFTEDYTKRVLSDDNGRRASWTRLPVLARATENDPLNEIEYRVVEIKIGDLEVDPSADENGEYEGAIGSYQPSQNTEISDDSLTSATTITNTLQSTKISATKTWTNDESDTWGTRPVDGANWTATYFLQSSTDNGTNWQWVVEAGSNPADSAADPGVVKLTISNGMVTDSNHDVSVDADGNGATVTWKNLPEYDANGMKYQYRVVEQVPGSYDVEGGTQVSDTDTAHRYYVVSNASDTGDDPSSQSYTNNLRTVDLTGTKKWDDHGTGIAPDFDADNAPQMTLWRQVQGGTAEQVKLKNGVAAPQPTWTEGPEGAWTFTYKDLPAADENDKPYTYWAVETANSGGTGGFYPVYGSGGQQSNATHGAAGTTVNTSASADQNGTQTNETITNVATKLALDKVSDWRGADGKGSPESLTGIELSVQSRDGGTTYATWTNGDDGKTYNSYTWVNGTTNPSNTTDAVHRTDNLIVGLKAGQYKIVETGTPPAGYAQAPDVLFTINADGTATYNGVELAGTSNLDKGEAGVEVATENGIHTITVTAEDPVLRGQLQLTKYVSEDGATTGSGADPLEGATFDLYRVDTHEDADNADDLIASGLTSNEKGVVTTVGNSTLIQEKSSDGTFDLTYGGKYTKLSDGLPEGSYYFVETDAGPTAVTPSGEAAKSDTLTISQNKHYAYTNAPVSSAMGNVDFWATVELVKYDTTSLNGINGTEFSLKYRPEGFTDSGYPVDLGTFSTKHDDSFPDGGKDGVLMLPNLDKGDYLLTETKNTGYDVSKPFTATFTIGNENHGHTYMVWQDDGKAIDFQVTSGTLNHGAGVPNDRLLGEVTLQKQGAGKAIDATFELQMKVGDEWQTVVEGLETGNSYALTFNGDGVTATAADTGDPGTGRLTVTGLTWNTYRLVETATTPGYELEDESGPIVREFTIGKDSISVTNPVVQNYQTDLVINKANPAGQDLNGAKFTVKPVDGSTFAGGSTDAKTLTTEGTGRAELKGQLVVGGTYEIYEVAGPSGYDPVDATFRIHVENNGYLKVVDDQGQETDLPEGYERTGIDGAGTEAFSFIATNEPMAIELMKVSASDGTIPLAGATFRLTGQCMDGNSTHTYTTDGEGKLHIDAGLMGGVRYALVEDTAPAGYIQMETLYFMMDDRGEIVVTDAAGNSLQQETWPRGWTVNDNKISFTAADKPTRLDIEKVDGEDGDKKLPDAEFIVTPVDGSAFADGTTDAKTLTTGEDGKDSLVAELVVGGSYTIAEAKAPDGYTKIDGTMTVTVHDDGSIRVAEGTTAPAEFVISSDGTVQVFTGTVKNDPTKLTLSKTDKETNQSLAGATFELAGKFADGSASQTLDATEDATVELDKALLIADGQTKYTLTETAAPGGYEVILQPLVFTVATDGTITPDDPQAAEEAGWTVGRDGISVTASDVPIEVDLSKLGEDSGTTELTGAEFLVKPAKGSAFANAAEGENENGIAVTPENIGTVLAHKLKVGNTYTLEETLAPTGYEVISDELAFTVSDDGTLQKESGSDAWAISANGMVAVITATDKPIEVALQKTSASDSAKVLSGATFELYKGASIDAGAWLSEVTTGEDGTIGLSGLIGGETYTLRETQAPAGYELLPDVTFKVGEDGTVEFTGSHDGYSVSDNGGAITVTAADEPVEAQLVKTDEAGTPLAGAVFKIEGTFAGEYAGQTSIDLAATNADGIVPVPSAVLVAGATYTVTEVTAPDGYELAGSVEFTVGADGAVQIAGASADAPAVAGAGGSGSYAASADGGTAVVTAADAPVEIAIAKVSAADGGTHLDGAVFEVTGVFAGAQDEETREYTTASDGALVGISNISAELKSGQTYTLREKTAPAGYELIEGTLAFAVAEDGTVSAVGDVPAGYGISADKVSIVASDAPIEVQFEKRGLADDGDLLTGGKFTISGTFVNDATHKTSRQEIPFTTGSDATVIGKLPHEGATYSLVAGETYTVVEDAAPAGYEKLGAFSFKVDEHGVIASAEGSATAPAGEPGYAISDEGGTVTLTAHDRPIEVTLAKAGSNTEGALLGGAVFELFRVDGAADGEQLASMGDVETTAEGAVELSGLVAGNTYVLHEKTAPAGYELMGDVRFTVDADGAVALEEAPAGWAVANGGGVAAVTATDEPVEMQIVKTDGAGTPLAGAVFEVRSADGSAFAGAPELNGSGALEVGPTGSDGAASVPAGVLVAGNTYVIDEVTAPDGYELAGSVEFTVGADGAVQIAGASADAPAVAGAGGSGSYAASADGGTAVVTAADAPVEIAIAKTDGGETLLPGAEFAATEVMADGQVGEPQVVTAVTGDDGTTVLTGLIAGKTYVLAETKAPAGYELLSDMLRFTVQPDGTIDAGWFPPAAFEVGQGGDSIAVVDEPLLVSFVKQAPNGAPLSGAEFTVEGPFPDGSSSKTFMSDESGTVFDKMRLVGSAEGTVYTVTETKAPDGYLLPDGLLSLVVYDDGTVAVGDGTSSALKDAASVSDEGGVAVVALENEPAPGTPLPQTGDPLKLVFAVIALAAAASLSAFSVMLRRRRQQ